MMDGDVCVLSYCLVCACSEGRRPLYWNAREEKRVIVEMKALSSRSCEPGLAAGAGLRRLVQVQEEDLQQGVKDQRTDS